MGKSQPSFDPFGKGCPGRQKALHKSILGQMLQRSSVLAARYQVVAQAQIEDKACRWEVSIENTVTKRLLRPQEEISAVKKHQHQLTELTV